jgi:hypothetical protein
MPYYIRILSPDAGTVAPQALKAAVEGLGCSLSGDSDANEWHELEVQNTSGEPLFVLERNLVFEGSLAQDEIAEFEADVAGCLPKSGAEWLRAYLPSVRTIYAFQLLDTLDRDNGWTVLHETKTALWNAVGGIFQADGEGFSNEEGYHILWQFSDQVEGDWWVAVLRDGAWQKFKIDLGNLSHREAFTRGQVAVGVERAP